MQLVIVYIVLVLAIGFSVFSVARSLTKKKSSHCGNSGCDGCTGCDIRHEITKNSRHAC